LSNLNILKINRKDGLFELITLPDRAIHGLEEAGASRTPGQGAETAMRAQERMGHSSMSEGWRDHTSPAEARVSWVMDEVMSGRMSQADGMVEMARAQEMMRAEARARTTHPEHRWEE
jgi:hypothetical protein